MLLCVSNVAGRKRNFNLIGLSSSIFSSQFLNIMVGMVLWKPPDEEKVRCWEDEQRAQQFFAFAHLSQSGPESMVLKSQVLQFYWFWECMGLWWEKDQMWAKRWWRIHWPGTTVELLMNIWTMQSQYWLCFPWFPLEIRLFWFCHRRLWSFQSGFMWRGWCQTN